VAPVQGKHGEKLSEAAEHRALRIIAATLFALAAGVAFESIRKLVTREHPSTSRRKSFITVVSLMVMPVLARAKRKVGDRLGSHALRAAAAESALCVWLSATVLAGLLLNAAGRSWRPRRREPGIEWK